MTESGGLRRLWAEYIKAWWCQAGSGAGEELGDAGGLLGLELLVCNSEKRKKKKALKN